MSAGFKSVSLALPDVTLRLDMQGVIQGASLANSVSREMVDGWVGRLWAETVEDHATDQVRGMVADARANGVSNFQFVRQRFPSGLELPMEYNAVRLGGSAGLIAIGKNLQAVARVQSRVIGSQHAREQESWKLREVETRNRLLFDNSDDPILLLRADDFSVVEANPAAIRAGALDAGRDFPAAIATRDQPAFRTMMAQVGEQGRARGILVHIGDAASPWLVRASCASSDSNTIYLLRLSPAIDTQPPVSSRSGVEELIEDLPEGFAVVGEDGAVRRANRAFLDLVQVAAPAAALGQPMGRWLSRPGADAAMLMASVRRHRSVRNFATSLLGDLGSETPVEIAAVAAEGTGTVGMLVHDVSRRAGRAETATEAAPALATLAILAERIGQTKLLDLVRETSDLVERHCIETALEKAGGNRTSAAGLLGLSRQSLYAKLARHGIGGAAEGAAAAD